ncbi:hypothetical protein PSACC_03010, partial [Paramicrosporidium saccamoebae]
MRVLALFLAVIVGWTRASQSDDTCRVFYNASETADIGLVQKCCPDLLALHPSFVGAHYMLMQKYPSCRVLKHAAAMHFLHNKEKAPNYHSLVVQLIEDSAYPFVVRRIISLFGWKMDDQIFKEYESQVFDISPDQTPFARSTSGEGFEISQIEAFITSLPPTKYRQTYLDLFKRQKEALSNNSDKLRYFQNLSYREFILYDFDSMDIIEALEPRLAQLAANDSNFNYTGVLLSICEQLNHNFCETNHYYKNLQRQLQGSDPGNKANRDTAKAKFLQAASSHLQNRQVAENPYLVHHFVATILTDYCESDSGCMKSQLMGLINNGVIANQLGSLDKGTRSVDPALQEITDIIIQAKPSELHAKIYALRTILKIVRDTDDWPLAVHVAESVDPTYGIFHVANVFLRDGSLDRFLKIVSSFKVAPKLVNGVADNIYTLAKLYYESKAMMLLGDYSSSDNRIKEIESGLDLFGPHAPALREYLSRFQQQIGYMKQVDTSGPYVSPGIWINTLVGSLGQIRVNAQSENRNCDSIFQSYLATFQEMGPDFLQKVNSGQVPLPDLFQGIRAAYTNLTKEVTRLEAENESLRTSDQALTQRLRHQEQQTLEQRNQDNQEWNLKLEGHQALENSLSSQNSTLSLQLNQLQQALNQESQQHQGREEELVRQADLWKLRSEGLDRQYKSAQQEINGLRESIHNYSTRNKEEWRARDEHFKLDMQAYSEALQSKAALFDELGAAYAKLSDKTEQDAQRFQEEIEQLKQSSETCLEENRNLQTAIGDVNGRLQSCQKEAEESKQSSDALLKDKTKLQSANKALRSAKEKLLTALGVTDQGEATAVQGNDGKQKKVSKDRVRLNYALDTITNLRENFSWVQRLDIFLKQDYLPIVQMYVQKNHPGTVVENYTREDLLKGVLNSYKEGVTEMEKLETSKEELEKSLQTRLGENKSLQSTIEACHKESAELLRAKNRISLEQTTTLASLSESERQTAQALERAREAETRAEGTCSATSELQRQIQELRAQLEKEHREHFEESKDLKTAKEELRQTLEQSEKKLALTTAEKEERNVAITKHVSEYTAAMVTQKSLQEEVETKNGILENLKRDLEALKRKNEEAELTTEKARAIIAEKEAEILAQEQRISNLEDTLQTLSTQHDELNKQNATQILSLKDESERLKLELQTVERNVSEKETLIQAQKQEIEATKQESMTRKESLTNLQATLESTMSNNAEMTNAMQKQHQEAINVLEAEKTSLAEKLETSRLDAQEKLLNFNETIRLQKEEIESIQQNLTTAKKNLDQHKAEAAAYKEKSLAEHAKAIKDLKDEHEEKVQEMKKAREVFSEEVKAMYEYNQHLSKRLKNEEASVVLLNDTIRELESKLRNMAKEHGVEGDQQKDQIQLLNEEITKITKERDGLEAKNSQLAKIKRQLSLFKKNLSETLWIDTGSDEKMQSDLGTLRNIVRKVDPSIDSLLRARQAVEHSLANLKKSLETNQSQSQILEDTSRELNSAKEKINELESHLGILRAGDSNSADKYFNLVKKLTTTLPIKQES